MFGMPDWILIVLGIVALWYLLPVLSKSFKGLFKNKIVLIGLVVVGVLFFMNSGTDLNITGGSTATITDLSLSSVTGNTSGTLAIDTSKDATVTARFLDPQVNETDDEYEIMILVDVERSGILAENVPVSVSVPSFLSEVDDTDDNTYYSVEKTTLGEFEVYFSIDDAYAQDTDPMDSMYLSFAEAQTTERLGITLELDKEAIDELDQYSTKVIAINIGNEVLYVEVMSTSA
jgi:hypothetical protein